ncbi:hypothetical protein TDB9533_03129 [Thalassocella blandensis]|nr:hypothetical protein TDB9533_03129 [Thalassocella blandensis]
MKLHSYTARIFLLLFLASPFTLLISKTQASNIQAGKTQFSKEYDGQTPLQVTLAADQVHAFKINHKNLTLESVLKLETPTTNQSTALKVDFYFRKNKKKMFSLDITDEMCDGNFESYVTYQQSKQRTNLAYFDTKLPWHQSIPLRVTLNRKTSSGFQHEVKIHDEVIVFETYQRVNFAQFQALNGDVNLVIPQSI